METRSKTSCILFNVHLKCLDKDQGCLCYYIDHCIQPAQIMLTSNAYAILFNLIGRHGAKLKHRCRTVKYDRPVWLHMSGLQPNIAVSARSAPWPYFCGQGRNPKEISGIFPPLFSSSTEGPATETLAAREATAAARAGAAGAGATAVAAAGAPAGRTTTRAGKIDTYLDVSKTDNLSVVQGHYPTFKRSILARPQRRPP